MHVSSPGAGAVHAWPMAQVYGWSRCRRVVAVLQPDPLLDQYMSGLITVHVRTLSYTRDVYAHQCMDHTSPSGAGSASGRVQTLIPGHDSAWARLGPDLA